MRQTINTILAIGLLAFSGSVFAESIAYTNANSPITIFVDGNPQVTEQGNIELMDYRNGIILYYHFFTIYSKKISTGEVKELGTLPGQCYGIGGVLFNEKKAIVTCQTGNNVFIVEEGNTPVEAIPGYNSWNSPNKIRYQDGYFYINRLNAYDIVRWNENMTTPEVVKEFYEFVGDFDLEGTTEFTVNNTVNEGVRKWQNWENYTTVPTQTICGVIQVYNGYMYCGTYIVNQFWITKTNLSTGEVIYLLPNMYSVVVEKSASPTPPTPPTPHPTVQEISGAKCETMKLPDPGNAEWYNFGELANTVTQTGSVEGQRYIQTNVYSGDLLGIDSVRIQNYGDGSSLPPGAIKYPGTDYARVNLNDIASTQIYLQSKRNGALQNFNLVQFHGVNLNGFQSWSASHSLRIDGKLVEGQGLSATGGIASVGLANLKVADTLIVNTPVSGFSGIRVGYARPTDKRWCSTPTNKCEFSYEGGSLVCQGVPVGGLVSGACGVAGSGSVWGSGSCVPLTNASGAIVEVDLPGTYTIVNNPDGTTTKVKATSMKTGKSIFSCVITGDSWYERLGQYLACPFTQIIPNLWDYIVSPIESVKEGIKPISTSGTGGSGLVGAGVNTGSTNPIINGFYGAGETFASDNSNPIPRLVKLLLTCVVIFCVVAVVATIVSITKN